MKALLLLSMFGLIFTVAAFGADQTSVEINGVTRSNITAVSFISGGKILVTYPGGGASTSADKLPADFLASLEHRRGCAGRGQGHCRRRGGK